MKNNFVAMGCFYRANPYGLVKTICRGFDADSGDVMIAYVQVGKVVARAKFSLCLRTNLKISF